MAGRAEIAGCARVPGQDWVVVVSQSRDAFAEPLNRLFRNVLISVGHRGRLPRSRGPFRPLHREADLTGGVQALQRGAYDSAQIGVHSKDEVG